MAFITDNRISRSTGEHYTKYLYQFNENDPIVGIVFGHFAPFTGPNGHGRLVQRLLSIGAKKILIATPNNTKPFDDDREMFSAEQRKDIIQAYLDNEGIDGEAIAYERRRGPVAVQMGPLCALAAQKFGLDIRPVFCFGPDRAEIVQDVCNPFDEIADPTHCEFIVDYDRGTSGTKVRELIRAGDLDSIMKETGYNEDIAQKLIDLRNQNKRMNEEVSLNDIFCKLLNEDTLDFNAGHEKYIKPFFSVLNNPDESLLLKKKNKNNKWQDDGFFSVKDADGKEKAALKDLETAYNEQKPYRITYINPILKSPVSIRHNQNNVKVVSTYEQDQVIDQLTALDVADLVYVITGHRLSTFDKSRFSGIGSSGNNGNKFEKEFKNALIAVSQDRNSDIDYADLARQLLDDLGEDIDINTFEKHADNLRPLVRTGNGQFVYENNNNNDVGSILSDITVSTISGKKVYISCKKTDTVAQVNTGIGSFYKSKNKEDGLADDFCKFFGINNDKFIDVFKNYGHPENKRYSKSDCIEDLSPEVEENLLSLLKQIFGHGYFYVHAYSPTSKRNVVADWRTKENSLETRFTSDHLRSAKIYYGGRNGQAKAVRIECIFTNGAKIHFIFRHKDGLVWPRTCLVETHYLERFAEQSDLLESLRSLNNLLKSFQKKLQEGGNLSAQGKFGVKSATKLQMDKFTPEVFADFKDDFMKFLLKLNGMYAKKTGHKVWENEKFLQSGNCFSGSTRTMFQKNFVDYSTFKKKVGDFDVQIPESEQGTWLDFINSLQDKPIDGFTIYGNTSNFAQDHSLVQATDPEYAGVGADFLQVDWEYVPFKNGKPTEFATFAHYSSWEDLQNNVKGLFVKLLLRAIGHCIRDDDTVLVSQKTGRVSKTKGLPRYNPNDLAFSVDKGVRHKLAVYIDPETGKPAIDPETGRRKVYNKDVKDSTYDTDMDKIFEDFFGRPPKDAIELKQLYSFIRCLKLMKANYTQDHIEEVFEYFLELIISPYAQKLSAFDKEEDREWKESAIAKFYEAFPYLKDKFNKKVEQMKEAYYAAYVNRARDSEVGDSDDAMHESFIARRCRYKEAMEGKHSLPHLYNYGKPSEMKDKDFYNFVEWLDENNGILDDDNSSINEKLDGSSQFFGVDDDGFFWEKFGSNSRYYSVDEIPPYFGMYKQLFKDLEKALQPELKSIKDTNEASEAKTQIEVILPNEGVYKVNLVTYKPDAFKKGGCLSIIQTLADGAELPNAINNEIAQSLSNLDYTVIAGYKLDNYKIDLSKELSDLLRSVDANEDELTIDELLELPARKWHQTKTYESFENCKMQMSDKILKSLSDKAGDLSEDGLYEGLVITLNNGFAFKVNSPMFKEAFANHRRR